MAFVMTAPCEGVTLKKFIAILIALNGVFVSVYIWHTFFFVEGIDMVTEGLLSSPSNDVLIAWGFFYAFGISSIAVGVILYLHWLVIERFTKNIEEIPTSAKIGW